MTTETQNYLILKPIAERFNLIAKNISDEDIEYIIKSAMKEQIKNVFDFEKVSEIVDDYIDNHESDIIDMTKKSIQKRLDFK